MPNPYLPGWEYIPDGEPRVFGDRVYIYGSHDTAGSDIFCDYKLKCWSADIHDLNNWVCHGDTFHVIPDEDHPADTDWTDEKTRLFAPDVVYKDGKYYLYAYIVNARGCVAVSDRPEGPFRLISPYVSDISDKVTCNGWFIDPGVLVDDDGRVYIYCGFERSFMCEMNSRNMYETLPNTLIEHILPIENVPQEVKFYEACSPRKVGDTYYLIYSPCVGSRLAYSTSDKPTGPFTYRGYIVDNQTDYPGGNDHGSIMKIGDQWYIFYHRMTNGTIMSRRGCVEKIEILPDGTIPPVEMTSLGFEDALNPFKETPADIACVLKGGCNITELNPLTRLVTGITKGCVIGYKYFDFGYDASSKTMELLMKLRPMGIRCKIRVFADGVPENILGKCDDVIDANKDGYSVETDGGTKVTDKPAVELGALTVDLGSTLIKGRIPSLTGLHSIFFVADTDYADWTAGMFRGRNLFDLESFVFMK